MRHLPALLPKSDVGRALRVARKAQGVSQEEFDVVSSRTYVSALERGIKQPTVSKVDDIASVLNLHPLTLLTLAYLEKPTPESVQKLVSRVAKEIAGLDLAKLG